MPASPRLTPALAAFALALSACASNPAAEEFAELLPAEELWADAEARLQDGGRFLFIDTTDYQGAIEKLQDIVDNYPYSHYASLAELRIADAYFEQERWDEALTYYRDFADLHPDHEKVPYTLKQAALCHYRRAETPGRDQTATVRAVESLERLMRQHPHSPEAHEAEALWRELRTRLGEHALGIGDFYLDREEWQSAADRYRAVLNEYPGLGLDAEALYKLGLCYGKMNREEEAGRIFQVILDHYAGSDVARAAEDQIPSAN